MEQDITALKKSFEQEYREFLAGDSGNREFRQGELFDKYRHLDISANDMAQIMKAVDSETQNKTSKLESYVRRINNCVKVFKIRSEENLEQENINESIAKLLPTNSREKIQRRIRTRAKSKFS